MTATLTRSEASFVAKDMAVSTVQKCALPWARNIGPMQAS